MRQSESLLDRFATAEARVDRTVITGGLIVPASVQVLDGQLHFTFSQPVRTRKPRPGMLARFLRLADATDDQIRKYSQYWGALYFSPLSAITNELETTDTRRATSFDAIMARFESLETWRSSSEEMGKVLRLAHEIETDDKKRSDATWREQAKQMRQDIEQTINRSLLTSSVRPEFILGERGSAIRLRVNTLRGILSVQMMLVVGRKNGIAICGSCAYPFETDGKRKVYCEECGLAAAQRAASKKLYRTILLARSRYARGESPDEIAVAIGRPIQRVKGWLHAKGKP